MLDDEDAATHFSLGGEEELREFGGLGWAHAGGRLVEQQQ